MKTQIKKGRIKARVSVKGKKPPGFRPGWWVDQLTITSRLLNADDILLGLTDRADERHEIVVVLTDGHKRTEMTLRGHIISRQVIQ